MRSIRTLSFILLLAMAIGCGSGSPSSDTGNQGTCTPEAKKCDGPDVVKCNSAGTEWGYYKECDDGCEDGQCKEPVCEPLCTGNSCGADGCGGDCGDCPSDAPLCQDGLCIQPCKADCTGRECGTDGCGGVCGICPDAAPLCEAGKCEPVCKPDCTGKECGSDGCGGGCGDCDPGEQCEKGACECVPDCEGKDCGIDGCGGVCGKCSGQDKCDAGKCLCQPACDGKECGADGCGGVCGECQDGGECVDDKCFCEPEVDVACCGDAICWFDSCGQEGETKESCALGCDGGTCATPVQVAVWIEEAVLGVHDIEGMYWDVDEQVSKELVAKVVALLKSSGSMYGAVAGYLLDLFAGPLMEYFEKPDPYGTAKVMVNGLMAPKYDLKIPQQEDTYHPLWTGIGWTDLPAEGALAIKIQLMDADFGFWNDDDPFGSVQIDKQEILDAMNNPGNADKCWVDVSAESSQTVLLVKIVVYPTESSCVPNCVNKVCGSDGCGGTCGTCAAGQLCTSEGACVGGPPDSCNGISFVGCCVENSLVWCEDNELKGGECGESPACGWSDEAEYYNCGTDGEEDPSATFPLECPPGTCPPKCQDKQCGDDGCGGSCGECPGGAECQDGLCADPQDECSGIPWEGCCAGTTLKYCENGQLLTMSCSQQPSCGWSTEGSFYDCGTAGAKDPSGTFQKDCSECVPQCAGKQCGDDGCGGQCGACSGGKVCQNGTCVAQGGCGAVTYEGCCQGQTLNYCDAQQLVTVDCSGNPSCGWVAQGSFYDCGTAGGSDPSGQNPKSCDGGCVPSCAGKQCGSDGCQGSCGTCAGGKLCQNGTCVASGGGIGDACTADEQCQGGDSPGCLFVEDGFPGGYCSSYCLMDGIGDCPAGATCFEISGEGYSLCFDNCNVPTDCRPGYTCDEYQTCFPL